METEKTREGKTKKQKESELKSACRELLELNGFIVYPQKSVGLVKDKAGELVPRRVAEKDEGTPDLLCCSPTGRFTGIELKTDKKNFPKNKREKKQKEHLEKIDKQGGIALVIDSIEELQEEIRRVK